MVNSRTTEDTRDSLTKKQNNYIKTRNLDVLVSQNQSRNGTANNSEYQNQNFDSEKIVSKNKISKDKSVFLAEPKSTKKIKKEGKYASDHKAQQQEINFNEDDDDHYVDCEEGEEAIEQESPQQLEMTDGEDNDFFGSADKDLMDENLKVEEIKEYYGDEADDDASDQDQNEDGLDID